MSLMDVARAGAGNPSAPAAPGAAPSDPAAGAPYKRPDLRPIIAKAAAKVGMPADQLQDQVDRIVAAGQKLMYSPKMAAERKQAIESEDPVPQRLAENVVGITLTLDRSARGGLPEAALFPAATELLGEAADFLVHAGQPVTQDDYNQAARGMFVLMGQKLGMQGDQIMGAAQGAIGGGVPADAGVPAAPPPAGPVPAQQPAPPGAMA